MKLPSKTGLHLAVATAIFGLGATSTPFALEMDDAGPNVSRSNTGQALIFPYYTVNNGWATTFNVMNTSDKTLAVKVRFHESKNSRDVLDFNIVMSPYDAWTGWVQDSPNGPQLFTEDTSCTSPVNVNGVTASLVATTGQFDDTGGDGFNRMREGYVEVLVMGESDTIGEPVEDINAAFDANSSLSVPYYAEHVDGVPRNCANVDMAFINKSDPWPGGDTLPTEIDPPAPLGCFESVEDNSAGSGYPLARCDFKAPTGNPLKGNVSWLNAAVGAGAGSEAIAVENWSTQNFVTAQTFPWFLEPTFGTDSMEDEDPPLWTITGVTAFEAAVSANATINEWASNPVNGAATDWVVTFPTKAFHVDAFNDQIQAASNKYRNGGDEVVSCDSDSAADRDTCSPLDVPLTVAPFEHLFGVQGDGDSKITISYDLYDREEGTQTVSTDGTTISPAPPPEITIETLRYEANVIQFATTPVLFSSNPVVVDAPALLNAANGWAQVNFPEAVDVGLPVTSFAVKVVNQGIASQAIGQAMDAGYVPVEMMSPPE